MAYSSFRFIPIPNLTKRAGTLSGRFLLRKSMAPATSTLNCTALAFGLPFISGGNKGAP